MALTNYVFTSEAVSEGQPDKIADQISDAVVDLFLRRDPKAHVACETIVTTNRVILVGEVRGAGLISPLGQWEPGVRGAIQQAVRDTVRRIGYAQPGFHWQDLEIQNHLHPQSADIAQGVDARAGKEEGAGDQGLMFGFACNETPDFMPATHYYAHRVLQRLAADRHAGHVDFLEPDAKSQVTLAYEDGKPVRATALVLSTQHKPGYFWHEGQGNPTLYGRLRDYIIGAFHDVLPKGFITPETVIHINPTGRFEIGGPDGDSGLTGRKNIVDSYGGAAPHGGGALSGKDPTKVDRSAAYACRYLAKQVVAAGLAERCTLQVSYAIGVAEPTSFLVDTHGSRAVSPERLAAILPELMSLKPAAIRAHLALNRPIYERTAAYGHFGRTPDDDGGFSWERLDLVEALLAAI